jgi:hypothetical protein
MDDIGYDCVMVPGASSGAGVMKTPVNLWKEILDGIVGNGKNCLL